MVALRDAGEFGATWRLEEIGGHRAGVVQVEVDADVEAFGTGDEPGEVGESPFVVAAELGEVGGRRQVAKDNVEPDAVDAGAGITLEERVGVRIKRRVEERVAEDGEVGIDKTRVVGIGGGGADGGVR